jgi:hypothetical protein
MHLRYIELQSYIAATCFGVIHDILRDDLRFTYLLT